MIRKLVKSVQFKFSTLVIADQNKTTSDVRNLITAAEKINEPFSIL